MIPKKAHTLLVGAHMSIAGGVKNAIIAGDSIDCTAIQIFTHSNRQWAKKKLAEHDIAEFKKAFKDATSVKRIVAHSSYLINLGSPSDAIRNLSLKTFMAELEDCHELAIPYLVIHPGSRLGSSLEDCLLRIAEQINYALEHTQSAAMVLLETMAGQGGLVGYSFEQLAFIRQQIDYKNRVGICVDTCHIFAAGYDLRTVDAYESTWKQFDDAIGLEHLKVIHMNDSKKELGSKVDRHAHIGHGLLGIEPFRLIMNDPRFFDIPKILETPEESDRLLDDQRNLAALKNLLSPETKSLLHITQ